MPIEYEATDNPDVFTRREIREAPLSLRTIRKQIQDIDKQIQALPAPKTRPDQETLEFWNAMYVTQIDREELVKQRAERVALVERLKALLVSAVEPR